LISHISEQEAISSEDIEHLDEIGARIKLCSLADTIRELGLKAKEKETWLFDNAWRICQCATSASVLVLAKEKRQKNTNEVFFVKSVRGIVYMVRGTFSDTSAKPRIQLIFADDNLTVHPGDLWVDFKTTGLDGEGGVDFKNGKKPEALVSRIIRMSSKPGDFVLDCFLGSGTTAAVAHKMNRRYIGIEMGDHAETHSQPRLKKVIEGEQGGISKAVNWQGGGGFNYFRLGETIFDELGTIHPNVRFAALAAHIWFCETRSPLAKSADSALLGIHNGTAYYLLYNGILGDRRPQSGNVLTQAVLDVLPKHAGRKIIYGEASRFGKPRLDVENIIFKQIPYDVRAV